MSRRRTLALVACLALAGACTTEPGTAPPTARPRAITLGQVDLNGTYANVGAMIVQSRTSGRIYPICSGTLIAPAIFLTAAHCTVYYTQDLAPYYDLFVSFSSPIGFGALTDLKATTLIPVTQVVSNPGYNQAQSDPGDIAVLLVAAKDTKGIPLAVLPTAGLLDALNADGTLRASRYTTVGYGLQDRVVGGGVPYYQDLNPIPRLYTFGGFDALTPAFLRLSMNPATGDGGTCYGDSGGPNFMVVNGVLTLVATTITGDAVCRATNVDYRLDAPTARAFLAPYVTLP